MEESDSKSEVKLCESRNTEKQMRVRTTSSNGKPNENEGVTSGEGKSLKRPKVELNRGDDSVSSNDFHERDDGAPSTDTSAVATGIGISGDGAETTDEARLEERRAYNRRNAARSRQRVKDQLRDLQQQVIAHNATRSELERTNVRLLAENNVLRDEVQKLRSILSGAPLFGQQLQSLQPFVQQQLTMGFNPATQLAQQGNNAQQQTVTRPLTTNMNTVAQPMTQTLYPNATQQQQNQLSSFFPSTTQAQVAQQDPKSTFSSQMSHTVGDSTNNGQPNAVVQLLLQQLLNASTSNANNMTQLPSNIQNQTNLTQPQMQQDNAFAALMAMVAGNTNPALSSSTGQQQNASSGIATSNSIADTQMQQNSIQANTTANSNQQQQYDQRNFQEMQQSFLLQPHHQQNFGQQETNNDMSPYKTVDVSGGGNSNSLGI